MCADAGKSPGVSGAGGAGRSDTCIDESMRNEILHLKWVVEGEPSNSPKALSFAARSCAVREVGRFIRLVICIHSRSPCLASIDFSTAGFADLAQRRAPSIAERCCKGESQALLTLPLHGKRTGKRAPFDARVTY